jgi:filamentous hemagglutinin family protein
MKHSVHKLLRLSWKIVMAGLVLPFSAPTKAEVTLDGTLGPVSSLAGPNFMIPDAVGQTVGTNLFHSFGLFNINTGESATFTGPSSIENVLGRVTGGSSSFIDGLLRTQFENASPNLFLLNPAGVLFGPNASLDVQGSFHVSTADYLKLGDGGRFEATSPENSVLTVAPPEAFGFLGENPAGISVQGSFLQVPDGKTLSVVGGDIKVADGSLYAPGGRIDIASVASPGEVLPHAADLGVASFERLGRIEVSHTSSERPLVDPSLSPEDPGNVIGNVDASGEGGGRIFIRGGQFVMDNSFIKANTSGDRNGVGIDINVDSLHIKAATVGSGTGGSFDAETHSMLLERGVGRILENPTGLFTRAEEGSTGDGGDITVNADSLTMQGSVLISASTFGAGRAGDLRITADSMLLEGEGEGVFGPLLFAAAGREGMGDGGDITVEVDNSLTMRGETVIVASTYGAGRAGDLRITADTMLLEGTNPINPTLLAAATTQGSTGDGGDITVEVDNSLTMRGSALIATSTYGAGRAGDLRITADTMLLEGVHEGVLTGLFAVVAEGSTGDGGDITVNADRLTMRDGPMISISTFGAGRGSAVTVNATDIELRDGATISAESFGRGLGIALHPDAGHSGNISIHASDSLRLFNGSRISVETEEANAGSIDLKVGHLLHLRGSRITTSVAGGAGDGGNIIIDPVFTVLDGGSQIVAQALAGHGGNIHITSDFFFKSPDSLVSAASGFPELSGTVVIDAPDTDVIAGFAGLPANFLDAATVLTQLCAGRSGANVSSLVVRKYEVLPDSPYALQVQLSRAIPTPRTAKQSRVPRTYYAGSPLPPMISCLGNG